MVQGVKIYCLIQGSNYCDWPQTGAIDYQKTRWRRHTAETKQQQARLSITKWQGCKL